MGQSSHKQLKESIETYMCALAQRNQSKKRYMKRKVVSQESHRGLKVFFSAGDNDGGCLH